MLNQLGWRPNTFQIFNNHPKLTLCLRDRVSFGLTREHFPNVRLKLVPDMAFFIYHELRNWSFNNIQKHTDSKRGILFINRRDIELKEKISLGRETDGIYQTDWLQEVKSRTGQSSPFMFLMNMNLINAAKRIVPRSLFKLCENITMPRCFGTMTPEQYLWMAVELFSPFDIIISNRLHGHILSVMMHKTNIFLPNSYHKNKSFFETWTKSNPLNIWADDEEELRNVLDRLCTKGIVS